MLQEEEVLCKVWDSSRKKKKSLCLTISRNLITDFLDTANQKLSINGTSIILEKDGTEIDDSKILLMYCRKEEIFMVLEDGQEWAPPEKKSMSNSRTASSPPNRSSNVTENSQATSSDGDDSGVDVSQNDSTNESNPASPAIPGPVQQNQSVNAQTNVPAASNADQAPVTPQDSINQNFANFAIRWEYFDKDTLQHFETGMEPSLARKRVYFKVVNKVIDELRVISHKIEIEILRRVAQTMAEKYPKMFMERFRDGGQIIGNGISDLTSKLLWRNQYLNRPENFTSLRSELGLPLWRQKALESIQAGCICWQPDCFPSAETAETMEEHRVFLSRYREFDLNDEDMVHELNRRVILTFAAQRLFINASKERTVEELYRKWPILFCPQFLYAHFQQLTLVDISTLSARFISDLPKVLAFGVLRNHITAIESETGYSQTLQALEIIFNHFDEEVDDLIMKAPVEEPVQNLIISITEYPAILVRETTEPDDPFERKIHITYNGTLCIRKCDGLIDALQMIIALYFMMNANYPKQIACFLEFVQRGWLNIGPDKARSKDIANARKAYTLIHKINDTVIADAV
ncbi:hypothetical protein QAD02_012426 [Eretmocerus hayati]|uniref:Uncharacterized protein n=1 Tax=Eretmocerus hayati TaxID=131215 RepID=A0ACC2P285_9HYME|nr:hypothetical protein QAD02_012426 [Eretmocerus hayati]